MRFWFKAQGGGTRTWGQLEGTQRQEIQVLQEHLLTMKYQNPP